MLCQMGKDYVAKMSVFQEGNQPQDSSKKAS